MRNFTYAARVDSGSANNPALNLTTAPSLEITFTAHDENGVFGDYVLDQPAPGEIDPDTQVIIDGVAYDFIFELSGTLPTQNSDGAQQVPDQFEGEVVVIITVIDYPALGETTRLSFMPNAEATLAEMDAFGNGGVAIQGVSETPPPAPVCFVHGTLILTPSGYVPVETLSAGARILNAAGKEVTLRWVASSHFTPAQLLSAPHLRPVCIPRDYLGTGYPFQDLWVSPQHKVAIGGWATELVTGTEEVLAAAKHLVSAPRFPSSCQKNGVEYFHLLFDTHELVVSNGLSSESLLPGPVALQSIGKEAQAELRELFPDWNADLGSAFDPVRPEAKAHEVRLIAQCLVNRSRPKRLKAA